MPARPAAASKAQGKFAAHRRIGMRRGVGKDLEGERQQRVSRQDCGRLIESLVHGRPPAAQIVIVHRRQVIVSERIAMHAFKRRAGIQRGFIGQPA